MLRLLSSVLAAFGVPYGAAAAGPYEPTWESLDSRPLPGWFDESKFGIFIHWGLFSVPAFKSEWYWWSLDGSKDPEFIEYQHKMFGNTSRYQDFAQMFQAKLFDPARWAKIFKRSGAKYVVLTAKHHEGFTMWPSSVSWNWNAMDVGPHRDLVGDLAEAVRAEGLTYGLYHSLFEWFNPAYLQDKASGWTTRDFVEQKTMPELRQIVEKYKPAVIWSDGDWEANETYWGSKEFLAWLYNDSPVKDTIVTNDRWCAGCNLKHGGYYSGADRQQPSAQLLGHKWENAMTVQRSTWGYSKVDDVSEYLTPQEIVAELISTVAFGGNMLLNVGPTQDGLILPIFEKTLMEVGDYLQINGEAIYASKPNMKQQNATVGDTLAFFTVGAEHDYYLTAGWPDFTKPVAVPLAGLAAGEVLTRLGPVQVQCKPDTVATNSLCELPLTLALGGKLDKSGLVIKFPHNRAIVSLI